MEQRILVVALLLTSSCFGTQTSDELSSLLMRFKSERNIERKEAIAFDISEHHREAGPELLRIAKSTTDADTEWLAIRYLGRLKFSPATRFLVGCLRGPHHYVRANAARALGEIHAGTAEPALIALLKTDQDSGVIQQTAMALEMLKAREAVPMLKARADNVLDSQTQSWLIGAIAVLGSRNDVSFVAKRLYSTDMNIAYWAAMALQQLTGEDLHLGVHEGPMDQSVPIAIARQWWAKNAPNWQPATGNR